MNMDIHSIKSAHFRVIHADGAFGGVSPKGYINCSFYSERWPIPKLTNVKIDPSGVQLSQEEVMDGKSGVLREYEASVMMDINTAASVYKWLGGKLGDLGRQLGLSENDIKMMLGGDK